MSRAASDTRRHRAEAALTTLQGPRDRYQKLSIQCRHGHHVAWVYDTPSGLVYRSMTGPHAHGSRDFVDTGHHGTRRGTAGAGGYVDLLEAEATADDAMPAWCDCGPRTLSRADLLQHVRAGGKTVRLA